MLFKQWISRLAEFIAKVLKSPIILELLSFLVIAEVTARSHLDHLLWHFRVVPYLLQLALMLNLGARRFDDVALSVPEIVEFVYLAFVFDDFCLVFRPAVC